MTIVRLHQFALVGRDVDRTHTLAELQRLGCTHVEPGAGTRANPSDAPPRELDLGRPPREVLDALKVLARVDHPRRQAWADEPFDLDAVVDRVGALESRRLHLEDRRDFLEDRIEDLRHWGDFRLPEPGEIGPYRLWFYRVPNARMRELDDLPERGFDLPWQVVHRDARTSWVVVVSPTQPPANAMPVLRTRTGKVSLEQLRRELESVEQELEEIAANLHALTRWKSAIVRNLARAADRASLDAAHDACARDADGAVFVVRGFVPSAELPRLESLAAKSGAALVAAEPAPESRTPTLLDNPRHFGGGEELVQFYQTPGYRDWDPSPVVAFSFATFFAMILADAGYALLLGAGLLIGWRKLGRTEKGARIRLLVGGMLAAGVVYGAIVGSWFGVTPQHGFLAKLHVLPLDDFDSMMRVSVLIGAAHLALANTIVASRARTRARAVPPLGWVGVLAGGLVLWLAGPGQRPLGYGLVALGLLGILFFQSDRRIAGPLDVLKRLAAGALGLTNITRLFGDVLSYLRLFALGLASSSLAMTFNSLASDIQDAMPGIGLLFAIVLLVIGHAINLVLGLIGGLVHGLRLNFIEFYQWGLSEEGRPFRPFAKREVER
ncbi:MAG: V-type ATP synthase subunit I [Planctomycetes bacterium]|nr:V-type ATP synthase subunit I [Planctomycetota bacterium]